jgi:hypothetical protein
MSAFILCSADLVGWRSLSFGPFPVQGVLPKYLKGFMVSEVLNRKRSEGPIRGTCNKYNAFVIGVCGEALPLL